MNQFQKQITGQPDYKTVVYQLNSESKYYERITEIAQQYLNPNGFLYFEINESFAAQTQALLAKHSFEHIQIIQDFKGKNRFVSAQKN
jgi:release factor glutamine methyltransferase